MEIFLNMSEDSFDPTFSRFPSNPCHPLPPIVLSSLGDNGFLGPPKSRVLDSLFPFVTFLSFLIRASVVWGVTATFDASGEVAEVWYCTPPLFFSCFFSRCYKRVPPVSR